MQKIFPKRRICTAIAVCCLPITFNQTFATGALDFQFEAMKETIPNVQSQARQYFVRLNVKPVSAWVMDKKKSGATMGKNEHTAYTQMLSSKVAEIRAAFEAAGFKPGRAALVSDIGFSIVATESEMQAMKKIPGVKEIVVKQTFMPQRNYSTPWVGAPAAHSSGLTGKGQTIAVIDTGTDYVHKDFGGNGDYSTNDPTVVEPGSFPTKKVVGGFDFAGFDYDAGSSTNQIPKPDNDPLDDGNHGSHVAGIAAGLGVEGILDTGIAPGASVMALKVFGASGSTSLTADAIEMAMDPNGDGDPSDAVDVINMSLGSPFGNPADPVSVASQNASDMGVVVVASAGNSGNTIPFVSGSPGSAKDVITVASTVSGGVPEFFVPFSSNSGENFEFFAKYAGISPPLESFISGSLKVAEPYNACTPLTPPVTDSVALITRGGCSFTAKLQNALDAGAVAAVVVNNSPGPAIVMGGSNVNLAAVMISQSEGAALLNELGNGSVSADFAASNVKEFLEDDNTMSGFSSRGPGPTGLFKPDISAPGSSITSALAGSGDDTLTISGTSMAAPQVAGMAAILRQQFPELGPTGIKAIIQNTSTPASDPNSATGTPPLTLQGTGIINIEKALKATSFATPGGIGFGRVKVEYNDSVVRYLTVTNFSDEGKRYQISVNPNNTLPPNAARISINSEIYVSAGQSQRIPVTLYLSANAMKTDTDFTELDGWIVLSSGDEQLRVGYQAVVDPASRLNYSTQGNSDTVRVRNDAFGDAIVYGFTLANQGSVDNDVIHAINALGFRSTSEQTMMFGLNAQNDWTNFSRKVLTMRIDSDEDGVSDYEVQVADLQFFDPVQYRDPTGTIVSAIVDLNNPDAGVQLLYEADTDFNNSIARFQIDSYGDLGFLKDGDTTFNYELRLRDRFSDSDIGLQTGEIDLAKEASFDVSDFNVTAQQSTFITVDGDSPTLWLSPTENSAERKGVVR